MLNLEEEFEKLGFYILEDEEKNEAWALDFPDDVLVTVTDDAGKLPSAARQNLIAACFDGEGRYLWGSEFATFMDLKKIMEGATEADAALLKKLEGASKTLKEAEWSSPSRP